MSESLCSVYSSCTSSSDAVYTITHTWSGTRPTIWGTYTDSVITVTGCPTGSFGWGGPGHHGGMPWGDDSGDYHDAWWGWGSGWSGLTTMTTTMTSTMTTSGSTTESVTIATVAQAVSDGTTQTSTVSAEAASTSSSSSSSGQGSGAAGRDSTAAVKVVGAALGAIVVLAGLL